MSPFHFDPQQKFTSPPPRYTEASLIKMLESEGIGRPSTYASIIQVIQDRKYVEQIERRFYATDLGEVVTDKLIEAFPT
jgi:DNA topoisomerase-1